MDTFTLVKECAKNVVTSSYKNGFYIKAEVYDKMSDEDKASPVMEYLRTEYDIIDLCNKIEDEIDQRETIGDIISYVSLSGRSNLLPFINMVWEFLDDSDLATLLVESWTEMEGGNDNDLISCDTWDGMFKKANKSILMTDSEKAWLAAQDDMVTVYRGVNSYNSDNERALSWTADYDKAVWFANRFQEVYEGGEVWRLTIPKDKIYCYFESRGESECIVSPDHDGYDIEVILSLD